MLIECRRTLGNPEPMDALLMARKATSKPAAKATAKSKVKTLNFRVSDEYAAWVDALAEANRSTVAGLIDQALADRARTIEFSKPAPRRVV